MRKTNLIGFDAEGFRASINTLSAQHERIISNAKARSQSIPSSGTSKTSRGDKPQGGLTQEEWETYYGEGV